jgi:hypothetical protein
MGYVPEELAALVDVEAGLAEIVDWHRTAPLLQHVQLLDVQIADQPKLAKGVGDRDFELAGYEVLATSRTGPLILEKSNGMRLDIQFLFHPDRSSLVYRVGFPIMIQNAIQIALNRASLSDAKAIPAGTLPPTKVSPETQFNVEGPHGFKDSAKSDKDGFLMGMGAPFVGLYEVTGDPEPRRIGVSLLATGETSMRSVERLQFPEVAVGAATTTVKTDQPLWAWFALAGLFFLILEWWYFQKRPSGVPA